MTHDDMNSAADELQGMIDIGNIRSETVSDIIKCLRKGFFRAAQVEHYHDGDKIVQHRAIERAVVRILGCRLHGEKQCGSWFCKRVSERE
jgi:hypothetical protein